MSVLLTSITYESAGVPQRKLAKILNDGMRKIAQNHRLVTMGDHFKKNEKTSPGGAYGYTARSERYTAKKLKRYGTDAPLVRTGKLMRWTRNNSIVTATQTRSQLTIKAPFPLTEQRRLELEAITPQEVEAAQKLGQSYVSAEIAKPENQLKRKSRLT